VSGVKLFAVASESSGMLAFVLAFLFLLINKLMLSVLEVVVATLNKFRLLMQLCIRFILNYLDILKVITEEFGGLKVSEKNVF